MASDDTKGMPRHAPRVGLILTGGGARAAYQVGVLKAVCELRKGRGSVPFPIICGTSAGAINAATLASEAGDFQQGVTKLLEVWANFKVHKVFRTEPRLAISSGMLWFLSLLFGGLGPFTPRSVLDNAPLRELLQVHLQPDRIQHWIDTQVLHAFSITAASYSSGQSVTFYQGHHAICPWTRTRRIGIPRPITLDHLMASVAIPVLFPAVRVGYEYYGDGSMHQLAPLSSALHLGADRLLVIEMRNDRPQQAETMRRRLDYPTIGQIGGYILDTLFMDSVSMDVERLKRINHTLQCIPGENQTRTPLRHVDLLTIYPSRDIGALAKLYASDFPRSVRYLLKGLGASDRGGVNLMSYLLFEGRFCRELIAMGHEDAMRNRHRIEKLLHSPVQPSGAAM